MKKSKKSTSTPILDRMNNYAEACLNGDIVVGELIKDACRRHFKDLERTDIYFDEVDAERVILFVESMVHVKGEWARKPLILEEWQVFLAGSVFGWKWTETQKRRFKECCGYLARKNAKTTFGGALNNFMLTADNEQGAEIVLAAAKEDQAKELFNICLGMVNMNPLYKKYYGLKTTTELIRYPYNNSTFKFVIGKPTDGGNIHCAHVDEYHEHKGSAAYDALKTGMGARTQPILFVWSTAGFDISCAFYNYLQYCEKVVKGIIEDDSLFAMLFTLDKDDDWRDFSTWVKANPNLGVSIKEKYLYEQYKRAIEDPFSRSAILTKHCNIWNNESENWIDINEWLKCGNSKLKIEDFTGEECWLGLDLASRVDLCSLAIVFKRENEYYAFWKHYHNAGFVNKNEPECKKYQDWKEMNWLTVTEGSYTDFRYVENDIKKLSEQYKIMELGYDPRESTLLMQNIREWAGFDCIEITQSSNNINEPMKILEEKYLSQKIHHQNDPIANWAASNVIKKYTNSKVYYPAKRANTDKIDPIMALIMALSRAEVAAPKSVMFIGDLVL